MKRKSPILQDSIVFSKLQLFTSLSPSSLSNLSPSSPPSHNVWISLSIGVPRVFIVCWSPDRWVLRIFQFRYLQFADFYTDIPLFTNLFSFIYKSILCHQSTGLLLLSFKSVEVPELKLLWVMSHQFTGLYTLMFCYLSLQSFYNSIWVLTSSWATISVCTSKNTENVASPMLVWMVTEPPIWAVLLVWMVSGSHTYRYVRSQIWTVSEGNHRSSPALVSPGFLSKLVVEALCVKSKNLC